MEQKRIRAVFMRGGTSKGVMFHKDDLPADREQWGPIFLSVLGTPDPNGRQLDGMGGGVSSLSKICVIGPPTRPDADVDFTFIQLGVKEPDVDYSGNCGNLSSAIGPFAIDEGIIPLPSGNSAAVRIHNTNTNKIILSKFAIDGRYAAVDGDMKLDGVAGAGAPIRLEFLNPGGAKTGQLLPTGNARDSLDISSIGRIEASLVDAANPCVFVAASALGATGTETPQEIEDNKKLQDTLEEIRCRASVAMGMAPDMKAARNMQAIPKVAMVTAPTSAKTLSGRTLTEKEADIFVRMISMKQAHRATPITGALCLAVGCRIPGSIPHEMLGPNTSATEIKIGHPSGVTVVDATVRPEGNSFSATQATLYRTARRLFQGEVLYREMAAIQN